MPASFGLYVPFPGFKSFHLSYSCLNRDQDQDPSDQSIVVVDGVPVLLPTYEEAVNSTAFPPPRIAPPVSLEDILQEEEPQPPEYPGHSETPSRAPLDTSECETYESFSDNSECVQSTQASSSNAGGMNNPSERTNVVSSLEETASTSPSVDIADGKFSVFYPSRGNSGLPSNIDFTEHVYILPVIQKV